MFLSSASVSDAQLSVRLSNLHDQNWIRRQLRSMAKRMKVWYPSTDCRLTKDLWWAEGRKLRRSNCCLFQFYNIWFSDKTFSCCLWRPPSRNAGYRWRRFTVVWESSHFRGDLTHTVCLLKLSGACKRFKTSANQLSLTLSRTSLEWWSERYGVAWRPESLRYDMPAGKINKDMWL